MIPKGTRTKRQPGRSKSFGRKSPMMLGTNRRRRPRYSGSERCDRAAGGKPAPRELCCYWPRQSSIRGQFIQERGNPRRRRDLTGRTLKRNLTALCVLALPLALCGCSRGGAPSLELFGAFFPAWMLCAVLGIIVALGARIAFTTRRLAGALPFQLPLCASIGLIVALLVWLLWFGR